MTLEEVQAMADELCNSFELPQCMITFHVSREIDKGVYLGSMSESVTYQKDGVLRCCISINQCLLNNNNQQAVKNIIDCELMRYSLEMSMLDEENDFVFTKADYRNNEEDERYVF